MVLAAGPPVRSIPEQRNAVPIGGTDTGKSHLAIAIRNRKFVDSLLEKDGFEPLVTLGLSPSVSTRFCRLFLHR